MKLKAFLLVLFGAYPRRTSTLRYLPLYLQQKAAFVAAGGEIAHEHAIFEDYADQAGTARGHYFHQDLLVAGFVHTAKPLRHIDVGSRIDGFVAHVAAFRPIEVIDIRPLSMTKHQNICYVQGNLMDLDPGLHEVCDSLSCLHAIEHFGLGRYGDPVDPLGHRRGFDNLVRMLKGGGHLYVSFPIGRSAVHFNAHRVFDPTEVLGWAGDRLELLRFDYVDDAGDLHLDQSLATPPRLDYGCGIYSFRKRPAAANA
ncbi:DUF268 domain-containing protein [Piscinibacter gummiphilus]|uniref:DUF268 domain-containing protein n=1 Tax=Piscinibacter gummiphilus TaxID=946333 RepID=A0ABZ0CYR6_9BURK|nr:DUF268 domain-containing protein [Piscinibacter gummiphilus]WOB10081.1 DUF268 domain-containing protein [Piscinibacter gummiphilus]